MSQTLLETLSSLESLMPGIETPQFDGAVPHDLMHAALTAADRLVVTNQKLLAAYRKLHAAYVELEVQYYHRSKQLVFRPGFILEEAPVEVVTAMEKAGREGFEAMKEGIAADRQWKRFDDAAQKYNTLKGRFKRHFTVELLAVGIKSVNWSAESLRAHGLAFIAAVECRNLILSHLGRAAITEERVLERESSSEIMAAVDLHRAAVAAVAKLY